jgi:Fibronectin type III domain
MIAVDIYFKCFCKKLFCFIVPGEPRDVSLNAVNSTTINVKWKAPKENDRNGIIRGYHIHVHEIKDEVS